MTGPGEGLDQKTAALVRLAALVAVGGAVPSYGAEADAAVSAGATVAEIVEVLVRLVPIVGLPRVVAALPRWPWPWGTTRRGRPGDQPGH